jgi:hypothetical protein
MKVIFSILFCFLFLNAFGQKDVDPSIFTIEIPHKLTRGNEPLIICFKNNSFIVIDHDGGNMNLQHYSASFSLLHQESVDVSDFKIKATTWDEKNRVYFFGRNEVAGITYYYDAVEQKLIQETLEWDPNGASGMAYFTPYGKGWIACSQVFGAGGFTEVNRKKHIKGINIFDLENKKVNIVPIELESVEKGRINCFALNYMKTSNVIVAAASANEPGIGNFSIHLLIYDTEGSLLADHSITLEDGITPKTVNFIETGNMQFTMMGIGINRKTRDESIYKLSFTEEASGEFETEDANTIFDLACEGELGKNDIREISITNDSPVNANYSVHPLINVTDGFYFIVEKSFPIVVKYTDPKTREQSNKKIGFNTQAAYVLKFDKEVNLVWNNCLEIILDHTPIDLYDLVSVASDESSSVKMAYIGGVADLITKKFDINGEVVQSASSTEFFKAKFSGMYTITGYDTMDYKEKSKLYHLNGNIFLGCHFLKNSLEFKKYEFE